MKHLLFGFLRVSYDVSNGVSENAEESIIQSSFQIDTHYNFSQLENTSGYISTTSFGIFMDYKLIQFENTPYYIYVIGDTSTCVIEEQFLKALLPIYLTSEISIIYKLLQFSNAQLSI